MKTLYALILLAFLGLAVLSCSDTSNPIVTTTSSQNTIEKLGGKIGSAGGGGNLIAGTAESGFFPVQLSVEANKFKDGSVTGHYEMHITPVETNEQIIAHGIIRGIKFEGNRAMLWADVTSGFLPELSHNWKQIIVITDNGEGRNATKDKLSNPWLTTDDIWPGEFDTYWAMTIDEFLETIPNDLGLPGDYPIESGNYQVRSE